jgi:hypothetical protein
MASLTTELEKAISLLSAQHPKHPVLTYELAGAYDTAGEEETQRSSTSGRLNSVSRETICADASASTAARCGGSVSSTRRSRCCVAHKPNSPSRSQSASSWH